MGMIIYHSGADSRYGELADTILFLGSVMMTFDKLVDTSPVGSGHTHRFWELLQQREGEADAGADT